MEYIGSFKQDPLDQLYGTDEGIPEHLLPKKPQAPPSTLLDNYPDTRINPYEYMGLNKDATEAEIKRAYKKGALLHHPDKHKPEDQAKAQKAFQRLTTAYAVLSDPNRRARYDTTGKISDALHMDPDDPWRWQPFYQQSWNQMSGQDIEEFAKEYRFSEEERQDLLMQYNIHKGSMSDIYEHVLLSNPIEDDKRYRVWINEAIKNGEVKPYKMFVKETQEGIDYRIEMAEAEAKEAEEARQELEDKGEWFDPPSDEDGEKMLALSIQHKNQKRNEDHIAHLMNKYVHNVPNKGGKRKKSQYAVDEPPDEAFELNRKKGVEEALRRDKITAWSNESVRRKRKAAMDAEDDDEIAPVIEKINSKEHPVKRGGRLRKKAKRDEEEVLEAAGSEDEPDSEDEDNEEDMIEPEEMDEIWEQPIKLNKDGSIKKPRGKDVTMDRFGRIEKPLTEKQQAAAEKKIKQKEAKKAKAIANIQKAYEEEAEEQKKQAAKDAKKAAAAAKKAATKAKKDAKKADAKKKPAAQPKTRAPRKKKVVVESDDEDGEADGPIDLGSQDTDEDMEDED